MPLKPVDIEELSGKAENIYEAIVILLKRARQINEEMKIEFNQRVEMLQTKIFEPEEETEQPQTNPDQKPTVTPKKPAILTGDLAGKL